MDKAPVLLALMSYRHDPKRPGVLQYRTMCALVFVSNDDEAVGAGVRIGRQEWPMTDGWEVPTVAFRKLTREETDQAAAYYAQPAPAGGK